MWLRTHQIYSQVRRWEESGNGFRRYRTDEEYVILRDMGLMPDSQSLQEANGHHYDRPRRR